jgi:hypothetical protein
VKVPLALRGRILLLDLRYGICKLMQISVQSIEEPQDRAPTDIALPDLKARDIGVARPGSRCQLRLRDSSAGAQITETAAQSDLIGSCHVG